MRSSLPAEESNNALVWLFHALKAHNGNRSALARSLGLQQPSVGYLLDRVHGVSYKTAAALAEHLGVPRERVLRELPPDAETLKIPPPPPRQVRRPDPTRAKAVLSKEHNDLVTEWLRQLRKKYRTQATLAAAIGMDQSRISQIVRGRAGTSLTHMVTIAKAVGISGREFLKIIGFGDDGTVETVSNVVRIDPPRSANAPHTLTDCMARVREACDAVEMARAKLGG